MSDVKSPSKADHLSAEEASALVMKVMGLLVDPKTAEQARPFLTKEYIQHNPNIASGQDTIIEWTQSEEAERARTSMRPANDPPMFVHQDDKIVMILPRDLPDPSDPTKTYRTYWFDMWRIEDGKLAEHWDAALKE